MDKIVQNCCYKTSIGLVKLFSLTFKLNTPGIETDIRNSHELLFVGFVFSVLMIILGYFLLVNKDL